MRSPEPRDTRPRVVSLCCGAGIGEVGSSPFFRTVLAVDSWKLAVEVFKLNHPSVRAVCSDIRNPLLMDALKGDIKRVDGIISTAPCPSFSTANIKGKKGRAMDPNNLTFLVPLDWVKAFKPRFFLAENVQNIKSSIYLGLLMQGLKRLGYKSECWLLDAADFGTPQHRARLFLVATRHGIPLPSPPRRKHGPAGSRLCPYQTIRDAVGHLSHDQSLSQGHEELLKKWRWIYEAVPPGGCWKDLDRKRQQAAFPKGPPPRDDSREFGRHEWHDVAGTVSCRMVDHFKKIHPVENRPFSVLECLLLQGVHPPYQMKGSVRDRYRLVGNGVPVQLMEAVCRRLRTVLP